MITQRQSYLESAILAALLLLTTAAQSAMLSNDLLTTTTPAQPSLPIQPNNSSVEEPLALSSHRPCRSEHEAFCENGGQCMYPQDSDEPSCICTPSYNGRRCLFYITHAHTTTLPDVEKLIGIICGTAMLIVVLAIAIYCFAYKKCVKSAPLIKSAPSELSV